MKHIEVVYTYTGYKIVEQRSLWKSPDTINVSSVGKTDQDSILIQEAESFLDTNHTDMKSLIQRLIDDEKMSNNHAEGIEEFSKKNQEILTT